MKNPNFDEEDLDDEDVTEESIDEEDGDCEEECGEACGPYPPRWTAPPYKPYDPYGCFPTAQPRPDITQQLLAALLTSQEAHISLLKEAHQKELAAQAEQHQMETRFLVLSFEQERGEESTQD